jgi:hypothetical protein
VYTTNMQAARGCSIVAVLSTYFAGTVVGVASWELAREAGRNILPEHPGCCCEMCVKDPLAREIAQRQLRERMGEIQKPNE